MQNTLDIFVSYVYRTNRKKEIRGDMAVALIVQDGVDVPGGISRSMIDAVRKYLADVHQIKIEKINILNLVRLEPEVEYVTERELADKSEVRPTSLGSGANESAEEIHGGHGGVDGEGGGEPHVGEGDGGPDERGGEAAA